MFEYWIRKYQGWLLGAGGLFTALFTTLYFLDYRSTHLVESELNSSHSLFVKRYPASVEFQNELASLKSSGRLSHEDDLSLQLWISKTADKYQIPRAMLWCLSFQESRLDHLHNMDSISYTYGLGQFTKSAFGEINRQTDRFHGATLSRWQDLMGQDVRPVRPINATIAKASSYFHIPTSVTATAIYLNNRYHHLESILNRRGISYHPSVLWVHAAVAYNKGTRGTLAIWNQSFREGGDKQLASLVSLPSELLSHAEDPAFIKRAIEYIWPSTLAEKYAAEMGTHIKNISSCAMNSESLSASKGGTR